MSEGTFRPHFRISEDSIDRSSTNFDGGGRTFQRNDFYSHGKRLIKNLESIKTTSVYDSDILKDRYFFEIHLAETEKLKEKYKNLKENSRIEILDVRSESIGYAMIKKQDMEILAERINEYSESEEHTGKSYFSFIEEYRNVNFKDKINTVLKSKLDETRDDLNIKVIIESFSSLPREVEEKEFFEKISEVIKEQDGRVFTSYIDSNGSVIIESEIKPTTVKFLAENFQSIKSLETAPIIALSRITHENEVLDDLEIQELKGEAAVCIFDTGINSTNPKISPFISNTVIDGVIAQEYDKGHGTFVASRVIYRDNLEEQISDGKIIPKAKVVDVCIFGKDENGEEVRLTEADLISIIRRTVRELYNEVKVYNLSLGFINDSTDATSLNDIEISRIASEIDNLSKKYGVLFVVSAGNIRNDFLYRLLNAHGYPGYFAFDENTRITPPSEAFLALSVGAIVTKFEEGALTEVNHPSPFSRRGPGFAGTRKPDLVADGGNVMIDGEENNNIKASALAGSDNSLAYDLGTSFAAPIISSYAAELFDLYPDASPNLIKGMLIHFANVPSSQNPYPRDINEHLGFGTTDINRCIESLKTQATYVHEGTLEQQTYYKIPFWIPSALTDTTRSRSGRKKLKIRATIIWNPLIDRRKRAEYSLIHLNANIFKLDNNSNEYKLNLATADLEPESYKERFYPVTRLEKTFERNIQSGLWHLELRMSHRWNIPEDYEQDFAVLISVEDPNDEIDVYSEIVNEVGVRFSTVIQNRM